MGSWTEYDMVRAENRMFDNRIYHQAMVDQALGSSIKKNRPLRRGLIWVLASLAELITIEGLSWTEAAPAGRPSSAAAE